MNKFTTTLNKIRAHDPCRPGWVKLLNHLGKTKNNNEPLHLSVILESNGLDDAIWALRACEDIDRDARLFAVWCARQVQHLITDPRSIQALDVAERYANGEAPERERAGAYAAYADAATYAAAAAAAYAAAACATTRAAADAAAYAAAAAYADARWAARNTQTERFKQMLDDDGFVGDTHEH